MREIVSREIDRVFSERRGASLHDVVDALNAIDLDLTQEELQEVCQLLSRKGWSGHGDCVAPPSVRSIVNELIAKEKIKDVFDPWSGSGNLLVDVISSHPQIQRAVGITPSKELWISAKAFWEILDASEATNKIEWRHGSPIGYLAESEERFDLVASVLPFGAIASREDVAQVEAMTQSSIKDDLGNLILLMASLRLRENGLGIFVVPPSFVKPREKCSVYTMLSAVGLNVDAYIALPEKTFEPFTTISTGIVIIRRGEQRTVFVAEIQENERRQALLIDNWRQHAPRREFSLGVLVDKDQFTGFASLRSRADLEAALRRTGLPIASTGNVVLEVNAAKGEGFEARGNAIYVPNIGTSPVVVAPEEFKNKPHNYFQWVLNPDMVDARYFAEFLNTDIGVLARKALFSGTVIPKMTLGTIKAGVPLAIPSLDTQRQIIREQTRIANLQSDLNELRAELWSKPKHVKVISDKIGRVNREETFVEWLETLPFPLASILWRYHTTKRSKDQLEVLTKFFEALAEFLSAVLLSAAKADAALWSEAKAMLANNREQLEKSSFGAWVNVAAATAKSLRMIYNKERPDASMPEGRVERMLATRHSEFVETLLSKRLISVLQQANAHRNTYTGHGGILTDQLAANLLPSLQASLAEVRSCYGTDWNRYLMISPTTETEWTGERYNVLARILKGSRSPFPTDVCSLITPLKMGALYFFDPAEDQALELLPLIKMDSPPMSDITACYFYNRIQPDGVRYISYHYAPEVERKYTPDEARAVLRDLLGR